MQAKDKLQNKHQPLSDQLTIIRRQQAEHYERAKAEERRQALDTVMAVICTLSSQLAQIDRTFFEIYPTNNFREIIDSFSIKGLHDLGEVFRKNDWAFDSEILVVLKTNLSNLCSQLAHLTAHCDLPIKQSYNKLFQPTKDSLWNLKYWVEVMLLKHEGKYPSNIPEVKNNDETPIEIWQIIYSAMVLSCNSREDAVDVFKSFRLISKLHYTVSSSDVFTTYLKAFSNESSLTIEISFYFAEPSQSAFTSSDIRFLMQHPSFSPDIHVCFVPDEHSNNKYGKWEGYTHELREKRDGWILRSSYIHLVHLALSDKQDNWLQYFLQRDGNLVNATSYIADELSIKKIQLLIRGRRAEELSHTDQEALNSLRTNILTLSAAIIDNDNPSDFSVLREFVPNAAQQPIPSTARAGETTTLTPFEYSLFYNKQKTAKYLFDTAPDSCIPKVGVLNFTLGVGTLTPTMFHALLKRAVNTYSKDDEATFFNTLCFAGNVKLVEYFLAKGQKPDRINVINAIESKNFKVFQLVFDSYMKSSKAASKVDTTRDALTLCLIKNAQTHITYILDQIDFDIWLLLQPTPKQISMDYLPLCWKLFKTERYTKTLLGADEAGNNLAHYLIQYDAQDIEVSNFLSKNPTLLLQRNKLGMTPIHHLLRKDQSFADRAFGRILKLSTTETNLKTFCTPDNFGQTTLQLLLEAFNIPKWKNVELDLRNMLLTGDNRVRARNLVQAAAQAELSIPLHFLAKHAKNVAIFVLFREQCFLDIPLDITSEDGKNLLHVAFINKNYDLIKMLGNLKQLIIKRDIYGKIPYEYIIDFNDPLLSECLYTDTGRLPLGLYCQKLLDQRRALESFLTKSISSVQHDVNKKEKLQQIQIKLTTYNFTLDQLLELTKEVRAICKQHPDEGITGLIKFNWLRDPENYQQFEKEFDDDNTPKPPKL